MWAVAGVLLGLVLLASIVGFHTGPHSHVFAGVLGVVTAIWLVAMAIGGQTAPLLWALLSADLVVSAGVGVAAYKGIQSERALGSGGAHHSLVGKLGVATSDLNPDGLVRVNGETWSATSLNGTIQNGGAVQVIELEGVRLKVWGEDVLGHSVPRLVLEDGGQSGATTSDTAQAQSD